MATEERVLESKHGRKALSPTKRARLEETFKRTNKKPTGPQDFDFAAELLAQCVIGDPANAIYVRAYIENLQKKYQNNKTGSPMAQFKERSARNALKKALAQGQWDEAICHGLQSLRANPWDIPTLTQMATAAMESGDSDSELCYLKAALTKSPKDPTCNRMAAIALDELGLVNQAIIFWQRVAEALPKDKEAKEAISAFQVGAKARGDARPQRLTAQEQEEIVRQRKSQQQEELARQQKIQQEEEMARQQKIQEQAAIEPANVAPGLEPDQTDLDDNRNEEARLPRAGEPAESAYKEGYDYGVEMPEAASKRKKIDPLSLAVIVVAWLIMIAFVALRWGPTVWKHARWPWWTWIVLGVVMLAVALGLRARQK